MYLHLGADCVVKSSEIVGIFSLLDKKANIYEEFVRPNLGKYRVVDLSGDILPSSCIRESKKAKSGARAMLCFSSGV